MRSIERSTVSSLADGFATFPDASDLDPGDATALHVREEPLGWGGRSTADEVTVLGVRPAPSRPAPVVWIAPAPRAEPPPPAEQLARGSGPMPALAVPRSSTAPAYPLVAGTGPRAMPPLLAPAVRRPSSEERPIAWGRLFAAVAVMSALIGGATAKLAQLHSAPAATRSAPAAAPAPAGVAVLPFENRSSDPSLRGAPARK